MNRPRNLLSTKDYFDLLDETDLILNVGNSPNFNGNKNQYGINYETKQAEYIEKKIKALARAHLYLHSLKPKFHQIENYLRWHPKAADAKAYTAVLHMYKLRLDEVRSEIKDQKEFYMPHVLESLDWSKSAKQHHEEFEIPLAKMVLAQMNKEDESYNAQEELAAAIKSQQKERYNFAKELENSRMRAVGAESSPTYKNDLANTLSKEMQEDAKRARTMRRQAIVNIIEGKRKSRKNMLRKALGSDANQYNLNSFNQINNSLTKQNRANYKAHLNDVRAKKQKRMLTKESEMK
jgi:hypothetical protein